MKTKLMITLLLVMMLCISCSSGDENATNSKEEIENNILFGSIKDEDYEINLIMYEGVHIVNDEIGVPEYTGELWQGKCRIELLTNKKIVDSIEISDSFYELMTFKEPFEIDVFKCGEEKYFLIGQYFSSNLNEYKLYRANSKRVEYCEEIGTINITGKYRYSCLMDRLPNGNYCYKFYDNSVGEHIERFLAIEGDKVKRVE